MSASAWLEVVKIVALIVFVWFGLIGWTLFRQPTVQRDFGERGA